MDIPLMTIITIILTLFDDSAITIYYSSVTTGVD